MKNDRCKISGCPHPSIGFPDKTQPTVRTVGDSKKDECSGAPIYPTTRVGFCHYHYQKEKGYYVEDNDKFCGKQSNPTLISDSGKTRVLGPDWR